LGEIISNCSSALQIPQKTSLTVFYHLAANHYWEIDSTQPIHPRKKVYLQTSNKGGAVL